MKLKHLPILYGGFLIVSIIVAIIIKVTTPVMTVKTLIMCWCFFICASIVLIGLTIMAISNHKQQRAELKSEIRPARKTPQEELKEYEHIFADPYLKTVFFVDDIDTIITAISKMIKKLNDLENLLDTTFSKTDLTYTTYKSSLNSVIGAFNSNLKSIKKRIDVFDYRAWYEGDRSDISEKYVSDIRLSIEQNEEILDKLDYLISELVSLDDPKNLSLSNLNSLIKQTQDYKNINNGGTT